MKNKKDTFCVLPSIHLSIRQSGTIAACCLSQEDLKNNNGELFNINVDSIYDVWNSNHLKKIRQGLSDGKQIPNCQQCWDNERAGYTSKRTYANELHWKHHVNAIKENPHGKSSPIFLELHLGNFCNLKCRICNWGSSSTWIKEQIDLFGRESMDKDDLKNLKWAKEGNVKFWNELADILPDVEQFDFYGGEPLLIEDQYKILKKSIESGHSKKQKIHYNTNGTVFPEDAIKNIWPYFKDVSIMLSIDDIGERFEYQRKNAEWDLVLENINRYKEAAKKIGPLHLDICFTVNIFNIFYIPEFAEWANSIGISVWLNMLHGPTKFNVKALPPDVKNAVEKKLLNFNYDQYDIGIVSIDQVRPFIEFMNSEDLYPKWFEETLDSIAVHDNYRNESFAEIFPEMWELLKPFDRKNI